MNGKVITYDGAEFKRIDCVPGYSEYHTIFVAKEPHFDEEGNGFQVINTNGYNTGKTRAVAASETNRGYLNVDLPRLGGKRRHAYVHRLVLLAWLPELPVNYRELEVNHKNENKHDNCFDNLELVTRTANINYGTRNERVANSNVKNGPSAKMVAIDLKTYREFHFITLAACARSLGLNRSHVCDCLAGRRKTHKGYAFRWEAVATKA